MPSVKHNPDTDPALAPALPKGRKTRGKAAGRKEGSKYHIVAFEVFSHLLRDYAKNGDVTLTTEYVLSKHSLKMDTLIVKKNREIEIDRSWGKIVYGKF